MATFTWKIENEVTPALPSGTMTLTFDNSTKIIKANFTSDPSKDWGEVTSMTTTSTPEVYQGKELPLGGPNSRDFTIWKNGRTLVCSVDPIHDGNGSGDVVGGSWTATDQ